MSNWKSRGIRHERAIMDILVALWPNAMVGRFAASLGPKLPRRYLRFYPKRARPKQARLPADLVVIKKDRVIFVSVKLSAAGPSKWERDFLNAVTAEFGPYYYWIYSAGHRLFNHLGSEILQDRTLEY